MDIDRAVTLTQDRLAEEGRYHGRFAGALSEPDFADSHRRIGMGAHTRTR